MAIVLMQHVEDLPLGINQSSLGIHRHAALLRDISHGQYLRIAIAQQRSRGFQHSVHEIIVDALIAAIQRQPLQWHLIITVADAGDPTGDATQPWPPGRRQMDVGILTLDHVESDDTSVARNLNFDPLILPPGMTASDDPLLSARSAVYSQSFTRREGESKTPAAVSPAETKK